MKFIFISKLKGVKAMEKSELINQIKIEKSFTEFYNLKNEILKFLEEPSESD